MTLMWALGDMLYESLNKHLFILYSPGGVGKSTVVNILGGIVGGTIPSISAHCVTTNPKSYHRYSIDVSQLVAAASSRLVNVPDGEIGVGDEL